MAELVDAPDSKSGFRKRVQVRFLFRAHSHPFRVVFYVVMIDWCRFLLCVTDLS